MYGALRALFLNTNYHELSMNFFMNFFVNVHFCSLLFDKLQFTHTNQHRPTKKTPRRLTSSGCFGLRHQKLSNRITLMKS